MTDMSSIVGRQINTFGNLSQISQSNITLGIDTASITDDAHSSSVSHDNSQSFVERIRQSLQILGLNVPEISEAALQEFTQNLYKALTQNSNNLPVTSAIQTKISGGTNFKYAIDLSGADLGENLANVKANITTALDNIGQFISSKAIFNLKILTESIDTNMLAQANATVISTTNNPSNSNADTLFIVDSIRGVDFDSSINDSTLYINLAKLNQMSFTGIATPDKYDLTTILTHEILHGLAFTGLIDQNIAFKTSYDGLISIQNGAPFFVGSHAKTENNGNPVPLSSIDSGIGAAFYHVAIPEDLMSASINKGEVKSISNLDVAMLEDMGLKIINTRSTALTPTNSKLQSAYNNPNDLGSSLGNNNFQHNELEASFSNLAQSPDNSYSTVNLQDFLKQFAFDNENPIQNTTGSFFSASA